VWISVIEPAAVASEFVANVSRQAAAFVGLSLADLDGERVLGVTRTWVSWLSARRTRPCGRPRPLPVRC
jgi:hypothetical protein